MTPSEIAGWIESACPHTCDFRGECWQCFTEAIDAATKPLREEVEQLQGQLLELKRGLKNNNSDFELAFLDSYLDKFRTLTARADQAEARNKALVEALRAAILELQTVGVGHGHTYSAVVIEKIRAALADQEERKQSLPKASEGA